MTPIDLDFWEPHPDKPGMLRRITTRLITDVASELETRLQEALAETEYGFEGLTVAYPWTLDRDQTHLWRTHRWPEQYRRIVCYVATGANEGHYIHVDIVRNNNEAPMPMFLTKTFGGIDHACLIAALCTKALGA